MINFHESNLPPICGSLHPATRTGFLQMLVEANQALTAGFDLIGLERIDRQLGVVYKKRIDVQSQLNAEDSAMLVG